MGEDWWSKGWDRDGRKSRPKQIKACQAHVPVRRLHAGSQEWHPQSSSVCGFQRWVCRCQHRGQHDPQGCSWKNMMGGYHVNVAALLLSQLLSITTMVYCCCCQYTRPYYHRNKVHNWCCSDDRLCFSRVVASWLFLLLLAIIIAGIDLASSLSLTVPCVQLPGITTTTTAPSAEIEDLTMERL